MARIKDTLTPDAAAKLADLQAEQTAALRALVEASMTKSQIDVLKALGTLRADGTIQYFDGQAPSDAEKKAGVQRKVELAVHPHGSFTWPVRIIEGARGLFADSGIYKGKNESTGKAYKEYPGYHTGRPEGLALRALVDNVLIPYFEAEGSR